MEGILFKDITKIYDGGVKAVSNFNLQVSDSDFLVLVGPSGCGKSTLLRMVAGLEDITAGELYFGNKLMNKIHPKDRDIAMVFQIYALYPHKTVYDNMAFGLKLKRMPAMMIEERVLEAAQVLDLDELLERKPRALSGGQRQRVALGRSMVRKPKVFLFDEPLSNLDAKLRVSMRTEIHALHKRIGKTFIYVTHDQVEAMTMGTVVAVMRDGVMQQAGEPTYLYENPANLFVAQFIGTPPMNVYDATFADGAVTLLGQKLPLSPLQIRRLVRPKERVYAGFRPEYGLRLKREGDKYCYSAVVDLVEELGYEKIVYATFDADESCSATVVTDKSTNVRRGDKVEIAVDPEGIYLFDKETEIKVLDRTKKFYTD